MNLVDAVLCSDVIEDAKIEGALVKTRAKLNKVYGRIRSEGSSNDDGQSWQTTQTAYDNMQPPEYMDIGEEGIPGIPVMG